MIFVSDTAVSLSEESAATLCLFAWCQAEREAGFLWKTGGMVLGQTTALVHWWRRRSVLSANGVHA